MTQERKGREGKQEGRKERGILHLGLVKKKEEVRWAARRLPRSNLYLPGAASGEPSWFPKEVSFCPRFLLFFSLPLSTP